MSILVWLLDALTSGRCNACMLEEDSIWLAKLRGLGLFMTRTESVSASTATAVELCWRNGTLEWRWAQQTRTHKHPQQSGANRLCHCPAASTTTLPTSQTPTDRRCAFLLKPDRCATVRMTKTCCWIWTVQMKKEIRCRDNYRMNDSGHIEL